MNAVGSLPYFNINMLEYMTSSVTGIGRHQIKTINPKLLYFCNDSAYINSIS